MPEDMDPTKSDRIVTVTVSDSRTVAEDESGRILRDELQAAGFTVRRHHLVKDEPEYIQELVSRTSRSETEAIILTGGTGIGPRDHTYDVVERLFEKRMEGFGEAFRRLSWDEVGPRSIFSRATAGILHGTVVFSLPGSERAVRLGVTKIIIPILADAMDLASGRVAHPPSTSLRAAVPHTRVKPERE